jgi:diguanylate cyclase (GGDEF)-like protein
LISTGSILALGIYLGMGGAMIGVVCASLVMLTGNLPQWPMLLLQLLSGGMIGGVINKLIFDLEATRNQLEHTAMTDALTGLENRRGLPIGFAHQLAQSIREGQPLLVTLWDINNLKRINDSEGHIAGDAYLKLFADALRSETRQGDFYYRTGGDEFVGLHLGMTDGDGLRDRIHNRFANVAVGWSVVLEDLETTLQTADAMMYETKKKQKELQR